MKHISKDMIRELQYLRSHGWSICKIARERSVAKGTVKKYTDHLTSGTSLPKGGRPKKLCPRHCRALVRDMNRGAFRNAREATEVARYRSAGGVIVRTVQRCMRAAGMKTRARCKKPMLHSRHISARKKYAQTHRASSMEFWKRVWFSDEKKWNLYGPDGNDRVYYFPGKKPLSHHFRGTMKFNGGGFMAWGVISYYGVGKLHITSNKVNSAEYIGILQSSLATSVAERGQTLSSIVFQQDNAAIHTSAAAKRWFLDNSIEVLEWPAQSPDMNIIEHLWADVNLRLRNRRPAPTTKAELKIAVEEEWYNTPLSTIQNLYESIPRRIEALRKSKGWHTRY